MASARRKRAEKEHGVGTHKSLTDFERQNPAAKQLVREVDEAMKIMLNSMTKEIRAVLVPDSK